MSPKVHKRSALQEDARFRILRLLQDNPEVSQREIAALVGISLGNANYVLRALIETGLVKLSNFQAAPDKTRYVYILTPRGVAEKTAITRQFLARKIAEYRALRAEIEALHLEAQSPEPPTEGVDEQN